ncbi:MAG: hypothetical protein ABIH23_27665 [bacterium]
MSNKFPSVPFGPVRISRLIIGGNPLRGNSHFSDEMDLEMAEYYSSECVVQTLLNAERAGMTTMQSRGDRIVMGWVDEYRRQGGTMHWIVQTATEWGDIPDNIREINKHGPVAIYHHGTYTDTLWKEGKIDQVQEYLKVIRDLGLQVGICSHIPEVFEYCEERNWDLDFYMASCYNLSREDRRSMLAGGTRVHEEFLDEDRELMCRFVRATEKTCLVFKILAAGRKCGTPEDVRSAYQYAFASIKPKDAVVVGMFPKYHDQLTENAAIVREICADTAVT